MCARKLSSACTPLGTICKNHTLDSDFHVMLKHIECQVIDKNTGEVLHDIRRTCQCEVKEDFDEFIRKLSEGFCRLIKNSSDNVIILSSEDYKKPEQQFIW